MSEIVHWFRTRMREGKPEVFDPVRRKYVKQTPEEEVRQMMLRTLVEESGVPIGFMAVEYAIRLYGMDKRCDIVVFSPQLNPLMIVECKARHIPLSQQVMSQAASYNIKLKVPYLLMTNGSQQYCCKIDHTEGQVSFLEYIPGFKEMMQDILS